MRRATGVVVGGVLLLGGAACTGSSSSAHPPGATSLTATPVPSTSPSVRPTLRPALALMMRVIQAHHFNVDPQELREGAQFSPGLRPVVVQRRFGDRCHNVVFFHFGKYVGTDGPGCSLGPDVWWGGSTEVAIVYPRFGKNDPTCCPTLDPDLVRFRLRGNHMERID